MRTLEYYRQALIAALARQPEELEQAVRAVPEADWRTRRTPDGSSVHQLAAHVRNQEARAYGPRFQRVLDEDRPSLEDFLSHAWTSGDYRAGEPLADILQDFARARQANVARMAGLSPDDWSRLGFYAPSGWRTAQWWAEHMARHAREHIDEIMSLHPKGP